jgi:hypothetical protein
LRIWTEWALNPLRAELSLEALLFRLLAEPATPRKLSGLAGQSVAGLAADVAEQFVGVDTELVQQVRVLLRIDLNGLR